MTKYENAFDLIEKTILSNPSTNFEELENALEIVEELVHLSKPLPPVSIKQGEWLTLEGRCPKCGAYVSERNAFCTCGQKLDWRINES